MSQEPRIRLIKDGEIVGIVWEDTNGDLVLEESEGNNELRVTSVSAAAERVDADELRANDTSSVTLGNTLDADNNDIQNVGELDSNSVNTGEITNKIQNSDVVNGSHPDFVSAQEAIDFATANDYVAVEFASGAYGPISVGNVEVRSRGRFDAFRDAPVFEGGPTSHGITITEDAALVGVAGSSSGGGYDAIHQSDSNNRAQIVGCYADDADRHDIYLGGRRSIINRSEFVGLGNGDAVFLSSESNRCVIDGNVNLGTVSDNGSLNVVGDNS